MKRIQNNFEQKQDDLLELYAGLSNPKFVSYCYLPIGGLSVGYSANVDNYYGEKINRGICRIHGGVYGNVDCANQVEKITKEQFDWYTKDLKTDWELLAVIVGCVINNVKSESGLKNPTFQKSNKAAIQIWMWNNKEKIAKKLMFGKTVQHLLNPNSKEKSLCPWFVKKKSFDGIPVILAESVIVLDGGCSAIGVMSNLAFDMFLKRCKA